jgi:hypothetical protein
MAAASVRALIAGASIGANATTEARRRERMRRRIFGFQDWREMLDARTDLPGSSTEPLLPVLAGQHRGAGWRYGGALCAAPILGDK